MRSKKLDVRFLIVLAALLLPTFAFAGTTGTEFMAFYTWINGVATGYGGRAISIGAVIIGALLSMAKNNPIPILSGVGFAIFLQYAPTIITGVLSATI